MKLTEYALWDAFNNDEVKKKFILVKKFSKLANFDADKRWAYILIEKLRPKSVQNHIVWAKNVEGSSGGDFLEEVTRELGIFGTLFGNIANGEVLYNAQFGHQLKTKLASENARGITTGNCAFDTAYLVD